MGYFLLLIALVTIYQQSLVFAMPQQCIRIFHQVEQEFAPGTIALGPEKLANSVNKGLFMIFDHFISFYHREVERIVNAPNKKIPMDKAKLMGQIALDIIEEFAARERRQYMNSAFTNRDRIKAKADIGSWQDLTSALKTVSNGSIADTMSKIKEVYQQTMWDQLEICDQSLMGLLSLIEVVKSRMFNIQIPDVELKTFAIIPNHDYLWEDRVMISANIDKMKMALTRRYFNTELQSRMEKKTGNFYKFVQGLVAEIAVAPNDNSLPAIRAKFDDFQKRYMLDNLSAASPAVSPTAPPTTSPPTSPPTV